MPFVVRGLAMLDHVLRTFQEGGIQSIGSNGRMFGRMNGQVDGMVDWIAASKTMRVHVFGRRNIINLIAAPGPVVCPFLKDTIVARLPAAFTLADDCSGLGLVRMHRILQPLV